MYVVRILMVAALTLLLAEIVNETPSIASTAETVDVTRDKVRSARTHLAKLLPIVRKSPRHFWQTTSHRRHQFENVHYRLLQIANEVGSNHPIWEHLLNRVALTGILGKDTSVVASSQRTKRRWSRLWHPFEPYRVNWAELVTTLEAVDKTFEGVLADEAPAAD